MLKLEAIQKNAVITGIEPGIAVTIRFVDAISPDAVEVNYRLPSGETRDRMLFRENETSLSLAEAGRPWSFDVSGAEFKRAVEA